MARHLCVCVCICFCKLKLLYYFIFSHFENYKVLYRLITLIVFNFYTLHIVTQISSIYYLKPYCHFHLNMYEFFNLNHKLEKEDMAKYCGSLLALPADLSLVASTHIGIFITLSLSLQGSQYISNPQICIENLKISS